MSVVFSYATMQLATFLVSKPDGKGLEQLVRSGQFTQSNALLLRDHPASRADHRTTNDILKPTAPAIKSSLRLAPSIEEVLQGVGVG